METINGVLFFMYVVLGAVLPLTLTIFVVSLVAQVWLGVKAIRRNKVDGLCIIGLATIQLLCPFLVLLLCGILDRPADHAIDRSLLELHITNIGFTIMLLAFVVNTIVIITSRRKR